MIFNEPHNDSVLRAGHIVIAGMATELQYETINPTIITSATKSFCVDQLADWDGYTYRKSTGMTDNLKKRPTTTTTTTSPLHKFLDSMGNNCLQPHSVDYIKKTMLLHDNILRQQVRELHQLYSVQRTMMNDLKNNRATTSDHGLRAMEENQEVRCSSSSNSSQKLRQEHGIIVCNEDCNVELTLSLGRSSSSCSIEKKKKKKTTTTNGQPQHFNLKTCDSELNNNGFLKGDQTNYYPQNSSSTTTLALESMQNHWIFQGF